jgi:hypothetical protein
MSRRTTRTYDDGMTFWQTRDAYRVQMVLLTVFYVPQCLFALFALWALSRGIWSQAVVYGLAIAALWGLRWVLCTGLPWVVRWAWRQLKALCGVRAV